MNRLSRVVVAAVLTAGVMLPGAGTSAVVEARQVPSSVQVCLDSSSGVVSRVALSSVCVGSTQNWSASNPAPLLCWDASSLSRLNRSRLVSAAPIAGCVAPLRPVPVGQVSLLCADRVSGVLRWPITGTCRFGNQNIFVRSALAQTTMPATPITMPATPTTMPATPTTAALVPSVSLAATLIDGGTFPKVAVVTTNVAGTVYFIEGASPVNTVSDITSAQFERWTSGVVAANTPTSIALDVDVLSNGYYRVFVANSQGVLSAPALNKVTISISRVSDVVALTCATGGTCIVGNTGPGGGIVFYVHASGTFFCGATRSQTCKYLEVAPNTWSGGTSDPSKLWAISTYSTTDIISITDDSSAYNNVLGIGLGYKNSLAIVGQGNDTTTAAGSARAYGGGSQSDWYLPTTAELNLLCQWARDVAQSVTTACTGGTLNTGTGASGGFSNNFYWSSSESGASGAHDQFFADGFQGTYPKRFSSDVVRPIRAF
jgi:hypothetical protein